MHCLQDLDVTRFIITSMSTYFPGILHFILLYEMPWLLSCELQHLFINIYIYDGVCARMCVYNASNDLVQCLNCLNYKEWIFIVGMYDKNWID